MSVTAAT